MGGICLFSLIYQLGLSKCPQRKCDLYWSDGHGNQWIKTAQSSLSVKIVKFKLGGKAVTMYVLLIDTFKGIYWIWNEFM